MGRKKAVADLDEISAFWTSIMRDEEQKTADRIRASELRVKSAGLLDNPADGLTAQDRALLEKVAARLE